MKLLNKMQKLNKKIKKEFSLYTSKKVKHLNGEVCEEGVQKVPVNWKPCCESIIHKTLSCKYDIKIVYWRKQKIWGIEVCDGGSSIVKIHYCPFCGKKLK